MHPLDVLLRRTLPLGLLGVGLSAALAGWFTPARGFRRGAAPQQPIPFSHRLHAGTLGMHCGYCHSGAWRSPVAGLPEAQLCLGCHQVTRQDQPAIQELARLAQNGAPLRWRRIQQLPDHAMFDHRPHVRAGLACQECHGEVQEQVVLERRNPIRMGTCLGCHRQPGRRGPEHCSACHR